MTPDELRAGVDDAEAERRLAATLADSRFLALAMRQAIHEETALLRVATVGGRRPSKGRGEGVREAGNDYGAGGGETGLTTAALLRAVEQLKEPSPSAQGYLLVRERTALPAELAQQTAPEMKYFTKALADGPRGTDWRPVDGELALQHEVSGERHPPPFRVRVEGHPLLAWLGLPNTVDSLQQELRTGGLPAVLLAHVVVAGTLELAQQNRLYITVDLDDLIEAIGWKPRSTVQREGMRRKVWRWLLLFTAMPVVGRRHGRYKDRLTGEEIDTTIREALITIPSREDAAQLAFDGSAPPLRVTIGAGPWIDRFRGDHRILTYFGNVRKIAAIPAGRTPGAWAQSIALGLNQLWREQAAEAQEAYVGPAKALTVLLPKPFTRPQLLSIFPPSPPTPTWKELLYSDRPIRAWEYWDEAIDILKHHNLIGHYRETPPRSKAQRGRDNGRQAEWEQQRLDIRPAMAGKQAIADIAGKAKEARAKLKAKRQPRARREAAAPMLDLG
jgi:hypothetical protein